VASKINAKQKGIRGELELAHFLRDLGLTSARRTEQYCGNTGDASDVVSEESKNIHWECKRTECLQIHKALAQATNDAGAGRLPVVMYKRNRSKWIAILDAEDLIRVLKLAGLILEGYEVLPDEQYKEQT